MRTEDKALTLPRRAPKPRGVAWKSGLHALWDACSLPHSLIPHSRRSPGSDCSDYSGSLADLGVSTHAK